MEHKTIGKIIKGVGGLYFIRFDSDAGELADTTLPCRARGKFRHSNITPLVGDKVEVVYSDKTLSALAENKSDSSETSDIMISEIIDRKNSLIRPPLANLDYMFVALASAAPTPVLSTIDKLISIAEFNKIEPVIIVGKRELDTEQTDRLCSLYKNAGFDVFCVSALSGDGVDEVREYINGHLGGKTAAFAGASGVGKSSLMNRLFPHLHLETGNISEKTERGKNTTRHVELFEYETPGGTGFVADTPGFSMIDLVRFDFFEKDDLFLTMREFRGHLGKCRFKKCTHTKEQGCSVLEAVKNGEIARSRHESYLEMYEALKNKHSWS